MGSADECSKGCEHNHQTDDSFMLEAVNGGASQVQSWHFMDDDFSNGFQDSMNSSDCISEAFVGKAHSSTISENKNHSHSKELQNFNDTKFSSLGLGPADDHLHYKQTLSAILGSSMRIIENPCFCSGDRKSSFVQWTKGVVHYCRPKAQQKLLKKILFTVPLMMSGGSPSRQKETTTNSKSESDDVHEKLIENEKLLVLRSMVPSMTEVISNAFHIGKIFICCLFSIIFYSPASIFFTSNSTASTKICEIKHAFLNQFNFSQTFLDLIFAYFCRLTRHRSSMIQLST